MSLSVADAGRLYDYAVEHPSFYIPDACRDLDWRVNRCRRAISQMRRILAGDEINLVCFQEGFGAPKRYELVGNVEDARPWVAVRLRALESQLDTVHSVARSLENATDGRTTTGKRARLIRRHVGRLIEDFAELDGRLL